MRGVNSCAHVSFGCGQIVGAGTYLDVLAKQSVEEVDVCGAEVDEVLEFLNGRRLHGQEAEAWGGGGAKSAIGVW